MKKLTFIVLSLLTLSVYSQSVDKGRLQIKGGTGIYFGGRNTSTEFGSTINAGNRSFLATNNSFSLHYNTHKDFSLGLFISNNVADTDTSNFESGTIGFMFQAYLINKSKFNLYLDARVGGTVYEEESENSNSDKITFSGNGSMNALGLGINKYFGNTFGIYLQTGYMRQGIQLDNYKRNGESLNFIEINKVEDVKTLFNGGYIEAGITIKLRNKSPKSE